MGITSKTWEEEYGGKVTCFLEASFDGQVVYERALPESEAIILAATLDRVDGTVVTVRRFGEIIYGAVPSWQRN